VYPLAVQALIPEPAVEALGAPVLPRASRIDVESLDAIVFQPSLDGLGDELGAVVRANAFGGAMLAYCLLQQSQHVGSLDGAVGVDAVALPGELVDQIERPQLAPSLGVVTDEVPCPDVVYPDRLLGQARREPLPPLVRAPWRDLKPFLAADALDHLLVGLAAQGTQLRGHLLVSKRRMLPRYADDLRLDEELAASDGLRAVAQCRAVDPQLTANGSPGTGQRGLDLRRNLAPPLRAQRFFSNAISRALDLNIWSARSFFNSVFSLSRSRRRCASLMPMPPYLLLQR